MSLQLLEKDGKVESTSNYFVQKSTIELSITCFSKNSLAITVKSTLYCISLLGLP